MILLILLALTTQSDVEAAHAADKTYATLLAEGWKVGETTIILPTPTLTDDQSSQIQRASLAKLAGSSRQLDELLRDSVTAPFILKLRDVPVESAIVRIADLGFAIHADFDSLKPEEVFRAKAGPPVEVGNMRFETQVLTKDELTALNFPADDPAWYVHSRNRMLDRILVESTDRVVATRSASSIVVSSRTDPRFDAEPKAPNHWKTLGKPAGPKEDGLPQTYVGSVGYVKVTKLEGPGGILWVEAHFAFVEPKAWFDGAAILRSKLSLVAQDQIRRLRRELLTAKAAKGH